MLKKTFISIYLNREWLLFFQKLGGPLLEKYWLNIVSILAKTDHPVDLRYPETLLFQEKSMLYI